MKKGKIKFLIRNLRKIKLENMFTMTANAGQLRKALKEIEECKILWGKYSCDCLHFEILSLEKRIAELSA